jgi:hypothetical protein
MANALLLAHIVVINILLSLNLATILTVCVSAPLQAIETVTFNRIGKLRPTFWLILHQYIRAANQFDNSVSTLNRIVLQY